MKKSSVRKQHKFSQGHLVCGCPSRRQAEGPLLRHVKLFSAPCRESLPAFGHAPIVWFHVRNRGLEEITHEIRAIALRCLLASLARGMRHAYQEWRHMLPRMRRELCDHLDAMDVCSRLCGLMPWLLERKLSKVWERLAHPLFYLWFLGAKPVPVAVCMDERRS